MLYCDFCKKSTKDVKRMIAGPDSAAICNECVIICMEALMNECNDLEDNTIEIYEENRPDFITKTCSCGRELKSEQLLCNPPKDIYYCITCGTRYNKEEFEELK